MPHSSTALGSPKRATAHREALDVRMPASIDTYFTNMEINELPITGRPMGC